MSIKLIPPFFLREYMIKIFIFAGQSNMDGAGITAELPDYLKKKLQGKIKLFENGRVHELLYKEKFGPEVGFALELLEYPSNDEIVFCKTAKGGANLYYDWNPDGVSRGEEDTYRGPMYPELLKNIDSLNNAFADQKNSLSFEAVLWMQGERDAVFNFMADSYKDNILYFADKLRSDIKAPDIPFIQGKIAPKTYNLDSLTFNHKYRYQVRYIQDEVSESDKNIHCVETIDLPQIDNLHFDTFGQIILGKRFAEKFMSIKKAGN